MTETFVDLRIQPTVEEKVEDLMYALRQHVAVAKEAKEIGYGDDLLSHSIKSAERIFAELEELL